jgi:hypothetical protein
MRLQRDLPAPPRLPNASCAQAVTALLQRRRKGLQLRSSRQLVLMRGAGPAVRRRFSLGNHFRRSMLGWYTPCPLYRLHMRVLLATLVQTRCAHTALRVFYGRLSTHKQPAA